MKRRIYAMILMFTMVCILTYPACGQRADSTSVPLSLQVAVKVEQIDDSLMYKTLGDSICDIILNAKTVTVALENFPDSTVNGLKTGWKLNSDQIAILNFLVSNPKNFKSNGIVYGQFSPNISFCFICKKKECKIKFDFGLRKLGVYDSNDKEMKIFDLVSMETLRFTNVLFPEVDFFANLLNYK